MNRNVLTYGLGLLTVFTACAPTATPVGNTRSVSSAANYNGYTEDLSATRPTYIAKTSAPVSTSLAPVAKGEPAVTPARKPAPEPGRRSDSPTERSPTERSPTVVNSATEGLYVNKKLDALLDTIAQKNRSVRYAAGYRIQVYVGNEREEADAVKLQIYQAFPELSPYLSYKQPTYRLKVGDFMRRLEAEWYLSQLKQQVKSVILQPDKVDIRRSLSIK